MKIFSNAVTALESTTAVINITLIIIIIIIIIIIMTVNR